MKITESQLREMILSELMADDEKKLKDSIVNNLMSLFYRHEMEPEEAANELASLARKEIESIRAKQPA